MAKGQTGGADKARKSLVQDLCFEGKVYDRVLERLFQELGQ